jgi:hypothetical protein
MADDEECTPHQKRQRALVRELSDHTEEAHKLLRKLDEERNDPDVIRGVLQYIVDGFTRYAGHSDMRGMARNHGVQAICEQLNKLQEDEVFQDAYEVVYKKKG